MPSNAGRDVIFFLKWSLFQLILSCELQGRQEIPLTKVNPVSSRLEDVENVFQVFNDIVSSVHEVASRNTVPFVCNNTQALSKTIVYKATQVTMYKAGLI